MLAIFIPIFVQAVFGGSASSAGTTLMPMMIGSVVGSMTGGLLQTRIPFRTMMIFSAVCFLTGMSLLATMTPEISRVMLGVYMFLAGIGVGFSFSLLPAASINNLPKRYRGSANSTNSFLRSFGMTVGIAIFGTIQTMTFSNRMRESLSGIETEGLELDPQELFTPESRAQIPEDALATITTTMSDSITSIFTLALIPISLALITTFFMGGDKVETSKDLKIKGSE